MLKIQNFTPFIIKSFQMWDHFFPLLFSKDSKSLKILDMRLREVGAKSRLNGTSKVNTQTNTHTNILTNRLIESIGSEGQMMWTLIHKMWIICLFFFKPTLKEIWETYLSQDDFITVCYIIFYIKIKSIQ